MRKKIYCFFEIILIFTFFIIPTLTVKSSETETVKFQFSYFLIIELVIGILLLIQHYIFAKSENSIQKIDLSYILRIITSTVTTYFSLCVFSYITVLIIKEFNHSASLPEYTTPYTNNKILIMACYFLISAFFEEMIFRQALPEIFYIAFGIKPFENNKKSILITLFVEVLTALLFAFSHRYMGIIGIINALVCHIVFRISYLHSKSIISTTISHFFFNFASILRYFSINN